MFREDGLDILLAGIFLPIWMITTPLVLLIDYIFKIFNLGDAYDFKK